MTVGAELFRPSLCFISFQLMKHKKIQFYYQKEGSPVTSRETDETGDSYIKGSKPGEEHRYCVILHTCGYQLTAYSIAMVPEVRERTRGNRKVSEWELSPSWSRKLRRSSIHKGDYR